MDFANAQSRVRSHRQSSGEVTLPPYGYEDDLLYLVPVAEDFALPDGILTFVVKATGEVLEEGYLVAADRVSRMSPIGDVPEEDEEGP